MSGTVDISEGCQFAIPISVDPYLTIDKDQITDWPINIPEEVEIMRVDAGEGIYLEDGDKGTALIEITQLNERDGRSIKYAFSKIIEIDLNNASHSDRVQKHQSAKKESESGKSGGEYTDEELIERWENNSTEDCKGCQSGNPALFRYPVSLLKKREDFDPSFTSADVLYACHRCGRIPHTRNMRSFDIERR